MFKLRVVWGVVWGRCSKGSFPPGRGEDLGERDVLDVLDQLRALLAVAEDEGQQQVHDVEDCARGGGERVNCRANG